VHFFCQSKGSTIVHYSSIQRLYNSALFLSIQRLYNSALFVDTKAQIYVIVHFCRYKGSDFISNSCTFVDPNAQKNISNSALWGLTFSIASQMICTIVHFCRYKGSDVISIVHFCRSKGSTIVHFFCRFKSSKIVHFLSTKRLTNSALFVDTKTQILYQSALSALFVINQAVTLPREKKGKKNSFHVVKLTGCIN